MILVLRFYAIDPFLQLPEAPRGLAIAVALALAHDAPNSRTAPLLPADVWVNIKPALPSTILVVRFYAADPFLHLPEAPLGLTIAVALPSGASILPWHWRGAGNAAAPPSQIMCWPTRMADLFSVGHDDLPGMPRDAWDGVRERRTSRTSLGPGLIR